MKITAEHRKRVNTAIAAAEAGNRVDFVCVLVRSASDYPFYPLVWAALLALGTPWVVLPFTVWPFSDVLVLQLLVFAVSLIALNQPPLRRWLVPRRVQRAAAHRAAAEQFFIRGLAATPERLGILLFVAHEERYARVLADTGAAERISPDHWQKAVDLLVGEARHNRHAEGFAAALAYCGTLADGAFARSGPRENSLPDRFVVVE